MFAPNIRGLYRYIYIYIYILYIYIYIYILQFIRVYICKDRGKCVFKVGVSFTGLSSYYTSITAWINLFQITSEHNYSYNYLNFLVFELLPILYFTVVNSDLGLGRLAGKQRSVA